MSRKVLVVDDSRTTRDMVSYTLRRAGYEVVAADDGATALAAATAVSPGAPIECVVTDLNMPGVDGVELVRRLRATPQYRLTPILLLTVEGDGDRVAAATSAGAAACLRKPFHPVELVETLARIV